MEFNRNKTNEMLVMFYFDIFTFIPHPILLKYSFIIVTLT